MSVFRLRAAIAALSVAVVLSAHAKKPVPATPPRAVATFESIGLYWGPGSNPGSAGCKVQYRKAGDTAWKPALNLWYDTRNSECRGSVVRLTPGTAYEFQLSVGTQAPVTLSATTWSENFPVAQTITVATQSSTLTITQGGSASGYVLYQAEPGAVIDVADSQPYGIDIQASYVIVRGFTVRGAQQHGIIMQPGQHDIVIEQNDVSGWGRYSSTNSAGWQVGIDEDSGITARCYNNPGAVYRYIIQRNKVHDPRYGANSWDWGHPAGPNAISTYECGGNNVIRYNEVWSSDQQHYYMDAIGGGNNDSKLGFPGADSDIYGNIVKNAWDDAIEAEGGGQNVRVWGNYIDSTTTGVATTPVAIGPAYVFRNVYNRSRQLSQVALDSDDRTEFAKSGVIGSYGNGRRYVFHNTLLQADPPAGTTYPLGAGGGITAAGSNEPMTNTVTRNNILHIWKAWWDSINDGGGSGNDVDYDLYNGNIISYRGAEPHGLVGTPLYASGNGWQSESGGMYQLDPASPGYGTAVPIANFNDDYAAPDIGAQQAGSSAMCFGVTCGL